MSKVHIIDHSNPWAAANKTNCGKHVGKNVFAVDLLKRNLTKAEKENLCVHCAKKGKITDTKINLLFKI